MYFRTTLAAVGLIAALLLAGCGGGNNSGTGTTIEGSTAATTGDDNSTSGDDRINGDARQSETTTAGAETTGQSEGLVISIGNDPGAPRYNQGVMSVPANTAATISYNNPSQDQHNWVLVEPGQEQAVADATEANGGNPEGVDGVIAWSETIAGGETTIDIPPLQAGGYPYICTIPGHFEAGHKGALNVT
ncbi:MAG TPA: plastocyanin/azurin family copper-binding protein [Herpetosiphonaceae bacterium]